MQISDSILELSASDLSQFLSCRHLTALNLAVALGQRAAPTWIDPVLVVLQQRRLEHERAYVDTLRAEGVTVADLSMEEADDAVPASLNAMRTGVDIIIQPALRNGRWFGRPDVLRRTEIPSTVLGRMKSSTRSLPSETTRSGSRARMGKSVRDDGALLPSFPWGPDQRAPFSLQRYIFGHKIGC